MKKYVSEEKVCFSHALEQYGGGGGEANDLVIAPSTDFFILSSS